MSNSPRVAYADESAATVPATGKRVYVLAATVVDVGADVEEIRARMRELYTARRRRGEPSHPAKLHWYDEGERHRARICTAVCALPAVTHVAVCLNSAPRRDERARAHCLEQLLLQLPPLGVKTLILERRDTALNSRDVRTVLGLRRRGIGIGLRIEHGDPELEELLWIPDSIAGAYTSSLTGRRPHWAAFTSAEVVQVYETDYR
jgi:hypothetical protein